MTTVKKELQDLMNMTQNTISNEDGTEINLDDYKQLMFDQIDYVARLLGIELE